MIVLRSYLLYSYLPRSSLWCVSLWLCLSDSSLSRHVSRRLLSGMWCSPRVVVPVPLHTSAHQMFKQLALDFNQWAHWSSQVCYLLDSVVVRGRPVALDWVSLFLKPFFIHWSGAWVFSNPVVPRCAVWLQACFLVLNAHYCGVFEIFCQEIVALTVMPFSVFLCISFLSLFSL